MNSQSNGFIADVYNSVDRIIKNSASAAPQTIILTPSIGSPYLVKTIRSVLDQDRTDLLHLIVIDGAAFEERVRQLTAPFEGERLRVCVLPFNTGRDGMNGHRIYASFPLLLNADYLLFLDEDNWWDSYHVGSLIDAMENSGADWAYSLRKIYTYDEAFIAEDNCESIGPHLPYSHLRNNWPSYVDTNCYAFKRNTIVQTAHFWYHPLRADRYVFHQLIKLFPNYATTKLYSANYRLKKDGPVSPEYILNGNFHMLELYRGELPWNC